MTDQRPDPDQLLAEVKAAEKSATRGRLKIFFGASPGVGKTYAMLEAARAAKREGKDILIGVVETHGRAETSALTQGLDVLPRKRVEYKGNFLEEFDLEAALARKPSIMLLDELAHTNAPNCKHDKRWQDVLDLLEAGITVWSTLNVQHVESLNDVVAQITGVVVRETVPDTVLERADEVELVDLPPDDLLKRLDEGKVYVPTQAKRALQSFFRKGNLLALRELALRRTAERVNQAVDTYRREEGIKSPWPTQQRLLVAVGPSPFSTRLIRATRRMAANLKAPWIALNVEVPGRLDENARGRIEENLSYAEGLGAECTTIVGDHIADDILAFARARSVTTIVMGKPRYRRWRELFTGSMLDELIRKSGDIDVQVISGDEPEGEPAPALKTPPSLARWTEYIGAAVIVALCTLAGAALERFVAPSDLAMVYLLGVVFVSARYGFAPSVLGSVLSVACFNFFFIPPRFTFAVESANYVITFGVMFVVGLIVSALTSRVRRQAVAARGRETRTAALYALSRELSAERGEPELAELAVRRMQDVVAGDMAIFAPGKDGALQRLAGKAELSAADLAVVQLAFERGQPAGAGTDNLPSSRVLALPLRGATGNIGVASFIAGDGAVAVDRRELLNAFASQTAMALERAQLAEKAQRSQVDAETERLRNALLSSVSHDLRTPLAAITGATSTLLGPKTDDETSRELVRSIHDEARRMNRLVNNLLDMTRLESGQLRLRKEPVLIEEVVGSALEALKDQLESRQVKIDIPPDVPPVRVDLVLMEQVIVNLVENAVKYAPLSTIEISARNTPEGVLVEVADNGPGLPPGQEERVFDKFYRASNAPGVRGAGLGLTICRGILQAHGERIWARNRDGGGASFQFVLEAAPLPPENMGDRGKP
ncbi:MAG: sensor histidine kinase KdpD [Planctomycetes bacterium]|nr:sensor histidine kinase KdpD [Planctomycetota bacterium]